MSFSSVRSLSTLGSLDRYDTDNLSQASTLDRFDTDNISTLSQASTLDLDTNTNSNTSDSITSDSITSDSNTSDSNTSDSNTSDSNTSDSNTSDNHSDSKLVDKYFSYVNLNEQQQCILKYINENPLPEISMDEYDRKISDKTAKRNKKLLQEASDEDYHNLTLSQENMFLNFLHNFQKVHKETLTISEIEYYIKAFNYCNIKKLPIIKLSDIFKDNSKSHLVLIREYNIILQKFNKNIINNRRHAMIKGSSPDYMALSKLQNKYKYYRDV